jgi:hypothetical protein
LHELRSARDQASSTKLALDWAGRLLGGLRDRLDEDSLDFASKRQFVEALVAGVVVTPKEGNAPEIRVKFRFSSDQQRFEESRALGNTVNRVDERSQPLTLDKIIVFPTKAARRKTA